ncbi:hypothetical protein P5673_012737 [Acropora cervicornis]|uniref:Uncharacterized protein n=1 Tax=Acropora cervicornis TaxID=6130 RepID=A0AAD9V783_ACRCE|nr:hypothetical protein P5673_012737 [Acropora cervicornis]
MVLTFAHFVIAFMREAQSNTNRRSKWIKSLLQLITAFIWAYCKGRNGLDWTGLDQRTASAECSSKSEQRALLNKKLNALLLGYGSVISVTFHAFKECENHESTFTFPRFK